MDKNLGDFISEALVIVGPGGTVRWNVQKPKWNELREANLVLVVNKGGHVVVRKDRFLDYGNGYVLEDDELEGVVAQATEASKKSVKFTPEVIG